MFEIMTDDPLRIGLALGSVGLWLLICIGLWWGSRTPKQAAAMATDVLILSASQTGQAEDLARHTHKALSAGGAQARLMSLGKATADDLLNARLILCVVSTTGVGDAPDEGRAFEAALWTQRPDLSAQSFAVLALGDRSYEDFCAFGHRVFDWFKTCGATAKKPCLEVNDLDPKALKQWENWLSEWGGAAVSEDMGFAPWRLKDRLWLNPESAAAGLFHLTFEVPAGAVWQAGDLAEILTPSGHRRGYSIATLPEEGGLGLYVRELIKDDGSFGEGSHLLTRELGLGGDVPLRVKSHKGFHTPDGSGPVLLIGAGSGLAGLRPHLLTLAGYGRSSWLIYGERHPQKDGKLTDQMRQWQMQGRLGRLDLAFSRLDDGAGRYVQDVVMAEADALRDYLRDGGAVMVCGGLDMGRAVDAALTQIMGADWLEAARNDGRYRRDLY